MLLQSQLPPEFWGCAILLAVDIYSTCPHRSLGMQSPYFVRCQRHPDLTFFRPFGCTMIVHRGRDLVEHSKLAPRGEKCIYLGVGTTHGRRAFIGYRARLNRVYAESYATVDAKFDETHLPMRTTNQSVYGRHHQAHVDLDHLSLYHDTPRLSLIVWSNPPSSVSAKAPRFFVTYDSQFPLASTRFRPRLYGVYVEAGHTDKGRQNSSK